MIAPGMTHDSSVTPASRAARPSAAKPAVRPTEKPAGKRAAKPTAKPTAKPADPHAGHHMPGMEGMKMPADSSRPRKPEALTSAIT